MRGDAAGCLFYAAPTATRAVAPAVSEWLGDFSGGNEATSSVGGGPDGGLRVHHAVAHPRLIQLRITQCIYSEGNMFEKVVAEEFFKYSQEVNTTYSGSTS